MKKSTLLIIAGVILLLIIGAFVFSKSGEESNYLTYTVERGIFKNEIVATGELAAVRSERVKGPMGLQRLGIYEIKIQSLVPEGTFVKKGDIVGSLDPTALEKVSQEALNNFQQAESQFIQTRLDTSLTMRAVRAEIKNTVFNLEEAKITLAQSKYEPPATIRQEELKLEKVQRSLKQLKEKYEIQKQQAAAKMVEASARLNRVQLKMDDIEKKRDEFVIYAPNNGIVTYIRNFNGKLETGSTIRPWDPDIAELPDLSQMVSNTFVNEIDIRKIKEGQKVNIGLDAFPKVKLTGTVTDVANIGEKKDGSDAKIFPILITVDGSDSTYLPGMTTINTILIDEVKDVLTVPLDAVFNEDNKQFVYKKEGSGITKQEVELGKSNQNFVIIKKGLDEADQVLLVEPQNAKDQPIQMLGDDK